MNVDSHDGGDGAGDDAGEEEVDELVRCEVPEDGLEQLVEPELERAWVRGGGRGGGGEQDMLSVSYQSGSRDKQRRNVERVARVPLS